jgi:predicted ester cyclase
MSGIGIRRIEDGKMAEHRAQIDAMSLLRQLGAIAS